MFTEKNVVSSVESPPLSTSASVDDLFTEHLKNKYTWLIVKDVRPNYLFTTKRRHIDWKAISDNTILSQFACLNFCSKVH